MRRILFFKHWQLFLLIVLPAAWSSPSPLQEIIHCISIVTMTIWINAIGVFGQHNIKSLGLRPLNLKLFKTNIIAIPIMYAFLLILDPIDKDPEPLAINVWTILQFITALYFTFALIQTFILAAKTLTTLERRKEVVFKDYSANFILFIINLIGVWILQPKITKLIGDDIKTS